MGNLKTLSTKPPTGNICIAANLAFKTFHCAFIWFVDIFHHTTIDPKDALNVQNSVYKLSCTPFCPISIPWGHGLYKVSIAFHRDAEPCWRQCFPQLCQDVRMSFGWWTILDTHMKLLSGKNPAVLQFLTHSNQRAWHMLPYPVQRHFNLGTHTQSMA